MQVQKSQKRILILKQKRKENLQNKMQRKSSIALKAMGEFNNIIVNK